LKGSFVHEKKTMNDGRKFSWKWLAILLVVVGLVVAARSFLDVHGLLTGTLRLVDDLGPWGPVLFVLLYVLATVLFVPGSILTLGAGVLFGVVRGSLLVSVAATLGATAAFLTGRYFAREWVSEKIQGNSRFEAIDRAVAEEGWKIVGLTRLAPVFPFNLLNYAFGLTRVSLKDYVLASWIGMIPVTVLYVYVGSLVGDLATLGTGQRSRTLAEWISLVLGLMVAGGVTFYITRIARRALEQKVD
jgi:uncharacterized membrane protein YdjX (TVP38/TMEM64 family)